MKNKLAIRLSVTAIIITVISFSVSSCKKTSDNSASSSMGTFYFSLTTQIDTNVVNDTTALYRDSSGRHFGLSAAQFFIYNVVLQNVNGTTYTVPNAYILKDIDSVQNLIGTAPAGTYNSVTFTVGLDAITNQLSPTVFQPAGSFAYTSTMWYNNGADGYMFLLLKGFADTTTAQNGTNLVSLSYAIASSANLKTITMPIRGTGNYTAYPAYTLSAGGTQYIRIIADYGKLLSGINFKTQDSADTYYFDPALATTIANNIPNMFRYTE